MQTLAEWKARFKPGVQIRQVWNARQGTVDSLLTITKVQTNAIKGTAPKGTWWIDFPKRHEIEFSEKGWCRLKEGEKVAEYEWVEEGQAV